MTAELHKYFVSWEIHSHDWDFSKRSEIVHMPYLNTISDVQAFIRRQFYPKFSAQELQADILILSLNKV